MFGVCTQNGPPASEIEAERALEAEFIEQLRGELAALENRIRQAAAERVILLFKLDDLILLLKVRKCHSILHVWCRI